VSYFNNRNINTIFFIYYNKFIIIINRDDLIKNILDSKYVEHDSFFLFCQVMKGAKSWYEFNETISTAVDSTKVSLKILKVFKQFHYYYNYYYYY